MSQRVAVFDARVLEHLSQDTAVSSSDDEDVLRVRVRVHGQMGNLLLVAELVALDTLQRAVKDEDVAVVGRLEDKDVLVLGLLDVEDLLDLERVGLSWPLVVDLAEPSVHNHGVGELGHCERYEILRWWMRCRHLLVLYRG